MFRFFQTAVMAAVGVLLSAAALTADLPKSVKKDKGDKPAIFAAPVRIQAAGAPLNIGEPGFAAPFVCDFDNDGNFDLLVGVNKDGVLRVYRNTGTNKKPSFEGFDLFQAGGAAGSVPWRQGSGGFTPQFVDFDGDGKSDILSGSWSGQIYFFKGKGERKFDEGVALMDTDGNEIKPDHLSGNEPNAGFASTVFAADWNGDGKLDLLIGDLWGSVKVMLNEGEAKKPAYKSATRLSAGDKPINLPHYSHPIAVDWDGDGKLDLLVGHSDGSLQFFRNTGTDKEPKLAAAVVIVDSGDFSSAGARSNKHGGHSKICVFDWNGDGKLDLLLGDMAYFAPDKAAFPEAQKKELAEARKKIADLQKEMQTVLEQEMKLRSPPRKKETAEEKAARGEILKKALAKSSELEKESRKLSDKYRELTTLDSQGQLTEEQKTELATVKMKLAEASRAFGEHYQNEVMPYMQPPPDETPEAKQEREAKLNDARRKSAALNDQLIEPYKIINELESAKPGGSVCLFLRK